MMLPGRKERAKPRPLCLLVLSLAVMAELARDRTIILSTHIVADLGSGCEDLALIDRGTVVFRGSPAELLRQSRGQVVEVEVDQAGERNVLENIEVVARSAHGGRVHFRGVLQPGASLASSTPVDDPTLEEAYLAFMVGRGRAMTVEGEE